MIGWVFRLIVIFAILSLVYIALSRYQRWEERRRLQSEYDAEPDPDIDRETFIAEGMHRYNGSLKRNLLIGVYGIPVAAIIVLYLLAEYG